VTILVSVLGGCLIPICLYILGHRHVPSFRGRIETRKGARGLVRFLRAHDNEVVYLDIQCVPHGAERDGPAYCAVMGKAIFGMTADEGEQLETVEVFIDSPCPNVTERCRGTFWLTFRSSLNGREQVNNGAFGAGAWW
jgi:hypothetical protein